MAMNIKFEDVGIMGIIVGIIGAGYGIYQAKKSGDIAKKLDLSLEELEKKTPVEIDNDLINKVVTNSADRQVKKIVGGVADQIRDDSSRCIKKQVDAEIEKNKDNLKKEVEDRIRIEINKIDEYEFVKEVREDCRKMLMDRVDEEKFISNVREEAKKAMLNKYNERLNDILGDFGNRFRDANRLFNYAVNVVDPRGRSYNNGNSGLFDYGR